MGLPSVVWIFFLLKMLETFDIAQDFLAYRAYSPCPFRIRTKALDMRLKSIESGWMNVTMKEFKVPNGQAKTEPDRLVQSTVKSSRMVEIRLTSESRLWTWLDWDWSDWSDWVIESARPFTLDAVIATCFPMPTSLAHYRMFVLMVHGPNKCN